MTDAGRGTTAGEAVLASPRAGVGPSEAGPDASAGRLLAPPSPGGSQAATSEALHGAPGRRPESGAHGQSQPGSMQPGSCRSTDLGLDTGAHSGLLDCGGGAVQAGSGMIEGTSMGATSLRLDGSGESLDMGAAPRYQLPEPQQALRSAAGDSSAAAAAPEVGAPGKQDASWQQARAPAGPPAAVDSGQLPAASAADPAPRRASLGSDAAAAASGMGGGQASFGARDTHRHAAAAGWAEVGTAGASPPGLSAANAGSRSGQAAAVMEDPAAVAPGVSTADSAAGSNQGQASASSSAKLDSSGSVTQQSVAHYQDAAVSFRGPSQQPPTRWQSTASSFGDAGARSPKVLSEQDFSRLAHKSPSCDQGAAATQQLPVRCQRTLSSSSQGSALRSQGQAADDTDSLRGRQDSAGWPQRPPTRYQSAVSAFGNAMEGTSAMPAWHTAAPAAEEAGAGFDSRQALQAAAAETALTLGLCDSSKQQEGPACPPEQAAAGSLQQSRAVTEPQPATENMPGQRQDSAGGLQAAQEESELPAPQQGSEQSGTSQAEQSSGPQEAAGQAASGDSHSPAATARLPELAALLARAAAFCDRAPQQNLIRCACSTLFTCCLWEQSAFVRLAFCHRCLQKNLLICTCRLLPPVLVQQSRSAVSRNAPS